MVPGEWPVAKTEPILPRSSREEELALSMAEISANPGGDVPSQGQRRRRAAAQD